MGYTICLVNGDDEESEDDKDKKQFYDLAYHR